MLSGSRKSMRKGKLCVGCWGVGGGCWGKGGVTCFDIVLSCFDRSSITGHTNDGGQQGVRHGEMLLQVQVHIMHPIVPSSSSLLLWWLLQGMDVISAVGSVASFVVFQMGDVQANARLGVFIPSHHLHQEKTRKPNNTTEHKE